MTSLLADPHRRHLALTVLVSAGLAAYLADAVTTVYGFNVALILALVTTNIPRRQGFFFRLVWLLPRLTPSVVYILMWKRIASADPFGIYNQFMPEALGASGGNLFLGGSPWSFVILTNGFIGASFGMIIFTSALMSIPDDLITAAKVDGANTWRIIRYIKLPLIKWPLLFIATYQTLSLLTSFEYILLLTEGGPGLFTTEVWALTAYKRAFSMAIAPWFARVRARSTSSRL